MSAQIFLWALAVSNGPAEVAAFQACLNIANLANPISFGLCNIILTTAAAAYQEGDLRKSWRAAQTYIIIGISLISLYRASRDVLSSTTALVLLYGANSSYANFYHTLPIIVFAVAVNSVTDMVGTFIEAARGSQTSCVDTAHKYCCGWGGPAPYRIKQSQVLHWHWPWVEQLA